MKFKSALVLALSCISAACMTVQTTAPGAIGVERRQSFIVSAQEVENSAAQTYQQAVNTGRQRGQLNADQARLNRVRAIANRLIPQTATFRPDAPRWAWEINVLTSEEINAYCMPGGKIMVYTGLIQKLNTTDAELAAIIGHEIAHALREHGREKVSTAYVQQIALAGLGVATNASERGLQLAGLVADVTFSLPNSREMETEADRIGLELMARAGYDPNAAVTVFEKMGRASSSNVPGFLSTHPQSAARTADLRANLPRVMPLYQAATARN